MGATTNLILGGSGLIGKALKKQLQEAGEQVINLDIKEGHDLRTLSLDQYANVDFVWFLAWDSGGAKYLTNEKNFLNIYRNNTQICSNVLSFIEKYSKPFLFTSSQLAGIDTPYGLTKLYAERWTSVMKGKVVRLWNVYGWEEPDERSHVIPDLVIQGLTKNEISLMTSGDERRQFVYVDDCVKNLLRIRKMDGIYFSLTNGKWLRIRELAEIISSQLKVELVCGNLKGFENLIEPENTSLFTFDHTLQQGIDKILEAANAYLIKQQAKSRPFDER